MRPESTYSTSASEAIYRGWQTNAFGSLVFGPRKRHESLIPGTPTVVLCGVCYNAVVRIEIHRQAETHIGGPGPGVNHRYSTRFTKPQSPSRALVSHLRVRGRVRQWLHGYLQRGVPVFQDPLSQSREEGFRTHLG